MLLFPTFERGTVSHLHNTSHHTALHLLYRSSGEKQVILLNMNCKSTTEDNRKSVFKPSTLNYLLTELPHTLCNTSATESEVGRCAQYLHQETESNEPHSVLSFGFEQLHLYFSSFPFPGKQAFIFFKMFVGKECLQNYAMQCYHYQSTHSCSQNVKE